ncbi:hypothetical protein IWQ62_005237 [Dispira parvispora]|uniref:PPM-type phosphatase domain-containing protein n=1 Tax=Dispira parvispora TaxID=1520584 RepID=A0A9W8AR90_9FUNG|nr:hypothetical protein IWQ62_005237 [Dispira parvispora]
MTMQMRYGSSSDQGRRQVQQDLVLTLPRLFNDDTYHFFAVLDGHGDHGHKVAQLVQTRFAKLLEEYAPQIRQDPEGIWSTIFSRLDEEVIDAPDSELDPYLSGTTVSALLLCEDKFVVINLGDSRVIHGFSTCITSEASERDVDEPSQSDPLPAVAEAIATDYPLNETKNEAKGHQDSSTDGKWTIEQLTRDHTCSDPEERARVIAKGARVDQLFDGMQRIGPLRLFKGSLPYPGLVVTRALGDTSARRLGVHATPEVTTFPLLSGHHCFVLATDGVWDGLTNENVLDLVAPFYSLESNHGAEEASSTLTRHSLQALDRIMIDDNTSNVCIFLSVP